MYVSYVCVYICTYTCMHTCIYTYVQIYGSGTIRISYIYIKAAHVFSSYAYIYTYTYIYIHTHTYIYIHMYGYTYIGRYHEKMPIRLPYIHTNMHTYA